MIQHTKILIKEGDLTIDVVTENNMEDFLHAEIRYLMDMVKEGIFPLSWAGTESKPIEDMLLKGNDLTIEEVLEHMLEMQSRTYHHLHDMSIVCITQYDSTL